MGRALDIEVRVIPARVANPFVDRTHYSGKHVNNSKLHFGAFLDGRLHGVMSFGPPMDKSHVLHLVEGTTWDGMLELNRLAFDDTLPRNSESRCLSVAFRLLRKNAPHVKWILSFADGTQCGDGTIYRAAGFILTQISKNKTIIEMPDGTHVADLVISNQRCKPRPELGGLSPMEVCDGKYSLSRYLERTGGRILDGYMLRYIYFLDKRWRNRLTVPELPYSAIADAGAGMYKGVRR